MKTETIEIKKEIYIAFDGTEFECEKECRLYEKSALNILIERLNGKIFSVFNSESIIPFKSGLKYYSIMPKTRNDINTINQILNMSVKRNDDSAQSVDIFKLIILCLDIENNIIQDAFIVRTEKLINEISKGKFEVVSLIKSDDIKENIK